MRSKLKLFEPEVLTMAGNTTFYISSDAGAQDEMEYLATQIKEEPLENWIIKEDNLALLSVDEELQAVKVELMAAEPVMLQHLTFLDQNADLPVTGHSQGVVDKLIERDFSTTPHGENFEEITVLTPKKTATRCLRKNPPRIRVDSCKRDKSKVKKVQKLPKTRRKRRTNRSSKNLPHGERENNGAASDREISGASSDRGKSGAASDREKSGAAMLYSCCLCNYSRMKTFKDLKKHIKNHVVGSTHKCQFCSFSTHRPTILQSHYLSGHTRFDRSSKRIHCLLCPYNCLRSEAIRTHLFLTHLNEAKFRCSVCGYKTNCKYRLDDHSVVHKSERPFSCPHANCPFTARHKSCVAKHFRKCHAEGNQCKVCAANDSKAGEDYKTNFDSCQCSPHPTMREKGAADLEMKDLKAGVDRSGYPFSCDLCGARFLAKAKCQRHLLIHDSFKRHFCNQCDYSTNRSDTLKIHLLTHSHIKKYHCHICKRLLKSVRNLKVHIKRHSRFDPFLCPLCPYAAKSKSVLTFHIKSHGKDAAQAVIKKIKQNLSNPSEIYEKMVASSPFKEEIQRTVIKKRSSLMLPKSMDHYVCIICGFMTRSLPSLSQHKLVHEEKQYLCDYCAFRCGRKYNLQLHLLTHFKERPFKCQVCSFASKSPSNLIKHKRLYHHVNENTEEQDVKIDQKCPNGY